MVVSPPPGGGKSPSIPSPNRRTQRAATETAKARYQLCHDMLAHALSLPLGNVQRDSEIARYLRKLAQCDRSEPMTLDILVDTKIGRVVHKLRRDYPEAAMLRDRWLKLMPESAVSQQTKEKWEKDQKRENAPSQTPAPADPMSTPLLVKVPNGAIGGSSTVLLPKAQPPVPGPAQRETPPPQRELPMPAELMVSTSDDQDELHRKLIVATLFQAGPRAAMMQSVLEKKLELRPGTLRKPLHDAALTGHFLFNSMTKTWELTQSYYKHLKKQTLTCQFDHPSINATESDRKRKMQFTQDGRPAKSAALAEEDPDPQLRDVFLRLIVAMPTNELSNVSARVMRRHAEKEMNLPEFALDSRKTGIAALGIRLVDDELSKRARSHAAQAQGA